MTAAIVLGLLSAIFYGATDFLARFATRDVGVLRTMVYGQWLAAIVLTPMIVADDIPQVALTTWMMAFASNAVVLLATACLYRALEVGRLTVVAPIGASYGGVTAVISGLSGESLSPAAWSGLVLLLLGGVVLAAPVAPKESAVKRSSAGIVPAAIAATLYGTGFWLQGRFVVPNLGSVVTVWSYYVLGALALPLLASLRQVSLRVPRGREATFVFGTAGLAVLAFLSLAAGQSLGSIAVVTMLSSLASAAAVMLGVVFLKERLMIVGWGGLAAIVLGLALLHS